MATILLGVTGSIAAYKACELTRMLQKQGHAVHILMTTAATHFVSPLTFRTLSRHPVHYEMWGEPTQWVPDHISLAERADLMVIAPCTANVIAKLSHGLADDILTATALATRAPLLLAPAMNTGMWDNPATQANLQTLTARGIPFVATAQGELACGTSGQGRLADLHTILQAITQRLNA